MNRAYAHVREEDPVQRVWAAYLWALGEFGKHPERAVLTPARRDCIVAKLGMYPAEDLVDAVRGWLYSPHHVGRNDRHETYYDLAAHILWTGTKQKPRNWLEAFRNLWRERQGQPYAWLPQDAPRRPVEVARPTGTWAAGAERRRRMLEDEPDDQPPLRSVGGGG